MNTKKDIANSILDRDVPFIAPKTAMVAGASGGIGASFCSNLIKLYPHIRLIRLARDLDKLPAVKVECQDIEFDLASDKSIQAAMLSLPENTEIDWVFIATGWLHDKNVQPEKSWRSIESSNLEHAFRINTIGPTMLMKYLLLKLNPAHPVKFGLLSARVGSISDNRLGGWHAYRASKAALNMIIKNFALEFSRSRRPFIITGLQPGTTDTKLSKPFQRNLPAHQLQTPDYTALQLIKVFNAFEINDSGGLFDFHGLPFAP